MDDPTAFPGGTPRLPQSYKESFEYIRSDYYRHERRPKASLLRIWLYGVIHPYMGFCFWLRLAAHRRGWFYPVARLMHARYARRYGLHILPATRIGYGLYLAHGFGTFVNVSALIGNNVNLSQLTTIGSISGHAATVGDNVYIGPGVCVVENVHIGHDTTIGAGSVVLKDIPPHTTAAGVPARVVREADHPDYADVLAAQKELYQLLFLLARKETI